MDLILADPPPDTLQDCLLASLCTHENSINVVRWDHSGALLASAGADNYILVHKLSSYQVQGNLAGDPSQHKEHWVRCHMLQGHRMDVLDIAWGLHQTLASCSADTQVLVWDLAQDNNNVSAHGNHSIIQSPLYILKGHKSHVKGVSYDPLHKYLASYSADHMLCVWDVDSQYTLIHTVNVLSLANGTLPSSLSPSTHTPNTPSSLLFMRLAWSPDGLFLCIPAVTKQTREVCVLVRREAWEVNAADLVGHMYATCAARFSRSS
ncbi:hypothetical protein EON65_31925 [archaeon]|nr:MAG: hypothetical protein EON65_31925 [archaeon]